MTVWKHPYSVLDPIDRISEVLFGLIMVLTSTSTLSVLTSGKPEVATMIWGALGCNLAWGIIDAGLYVLGTLDERGRNLKTLRSVYSSNPEQARRVIAGALPAPLAALGEKELEAMRQEVLRQPAPSGGPKLTMNDALGALGICLLVFLSTFPPVIPFMLFEHVQTGLRVSNGIAIAMLFACGYVYARGTGLHPWGTGLVMVAIGIVMVGIAVLLGG